MRENIIHCSYLKDKISFLRKLAIQTESEAEMADSDRDFNNKYIDYKEVKSELKYTNTLYKNNCRLYDLFIGKIYKEDKL
jgi:hypothetical protein